MKKLYAGNLSYSTTDAGLGEAFSKFGTVESAVVIKDRATDRSKGFGFVEMDDDGAAKAIAALDGKELDGRKIKVNEARERN